ncbi:MAG: magnesium/cobalt transporter CorA [Candidatus Krumholzibacteriia bacterium]
MSSLFQRVTKPIAQSPGTIQFAGKRHVDHVGIQIIDYDRDQVDIRHVTDVAECFGYRDTPTVTWINVDGVHDEQVIRVLGERFGVHPLALEDVANTHQRPKLEDYDDHLFVVCRMLRAEPGTTRVLSEQLSLVLGRGFLLSFQERPGDVFDPVRERLQRPQGRLRNGGADYLTYVLLDAVIDHYFVVAETFGEAIEDLETLVLTDTAKDPLNTLHGLKRELVQLRRAVSPLRDVLTGMGRNESPLVDSSTSTFLRDAHDHAVQVNDTVESFRDMLTSLQDLAMANMSNRMNDVMKVLTVFASIFVPLTFVAGVYGMNFEHMPELGWRWAYPAFWGVILAMTSAMLAYFRRKKWF